MTTRVTEGARRACTPLNKSEEKERLLAVYPLMQEIFFFFSSFEAYSFLLRFNKGS